MRSKKNSRDKRQLRTVLKSMAGLAAVSAAIVCLCFYYVSELSTTLRKESQSYLGEISSHISESLDFRVETYLNNLKTIASGLTLFPSMQSKEALHYLQQETKRCNYDSIFFVTGSGELPAWNKSAGSFRQQPFFQKALAGEASLSDVVKSPLDGAESLAYAVPVNKDGRTLGVLCGLTTMKTQTVLSMEAFHGEGFCHIVDRNGDVIVNSDNENAIQNVKNCFSLFQNCSLEPGVTVEKIREEFAKGRSGAFQFNPDGSEKNLYYQPLPFNNWYLITVVPNEAISARTGYFVIRTAVLCGFVALLLILLLLALLLQNRRSKARLKYIAYVDPVTGGPSGKRFEADAAKLISASPPQSYAMIALNVEHFKLINEAYSQEQGDRVLHHIFTKMSEMLVDDELAARTVSDHFFLLLKTTDHTEIKQRLRGLWERVNQFNQELDNKYYINFSQGVYVIEEPSMNLILMEDRASTARKSAKEGGYGWGEPVFYQELTRQRMIRDKEMENRLFKALRQKEFVVYFQPKYVPETDTVAGAEALVRWDDPKAGLIYPNEFIPQFERSGAVLQLDTYVFEEVLRYLSRWLGEGKQAVPISVNLSRAHVRHPEFLNTYEALCQEYGVPPRLIEIEVTETLFNESPVLLTNLMKRLHDVGFTCSLDDFGSGYSSLSLLKDIPVDVLKLDRTFFQTELTDMSRGGMVVESILHMARKLNIKTVAEGVEDFTQVEFLRKVQCDLIQGFVYSAPLPAPAFESLAFAGTKQPTPLTH